MMQVLLPLCHHTVDKNVWIHDVTLKSYVFLKSPGQYLTDNDLDDYSFSAGTMFSKLTSKSVQCEPKCLHHFRVFFLFPLKSTKGKNFS